MKSILFFSICCFSAMTISAQSYQVVDVNSLDAGFNAGGDQLSTPPNFTNPAVTPQHDISFSIGNIWIGGYDTSGQLHVAGQTYRQTGTDFWAGAMDTATISSSNAQNTAYNKVWKINKTTIDSFRAGQFVVVPTSITSWPGNGNGAADEDHFLAPYVDLNLDGNYNYLDGDYPKIRGDQAVFFVFNDSLSGQSHSETGGRRLGIEVRCLAYAVNCGDSALENTVFMHYEIINRSNNTYDSTIVGLWNDLDIGTSSDGVSSDSAQNDYYYYDNYFAFGATFLNQPMASTMTWNNDFTVTGNPQADDDYYGYMNAHWKDNAHLTYGGTGYGGTNNTNFVCTGNPFSGNGWQSGFFDQRMIGSTAKFTFAPHQHYILDAAYVAAYDPSMTIHLCSTVVKQRMQAIKTYYNLDVTPCGDNVTLVPAQIENQNSINIFPNPASAQITIHTSNSAIQSYSIFDVTGQMVANGMTNGNETTLEISQLSTGMYFLRVGKDADIQTIKFVKTGE